MKFKFDRISLNSKTNLINYCCCLREFADGIIYIIRNPYRGCFWAIFSKITFFIFLLKFYYFLHQKFFFFFASQILLFYTKNFTFFYHKVFLFYTQKINFFYTNILLFLNQQYYFFKTTNLLFLHYIIFSNFLSGAKSLFFCN